VIFHCFAGAVCWHDRCAELLSGGTIPMGFVDVLLPLMMLSLAYFLLFSVARSRGNEEGMSRRTRS
jgi:hypothetical protein